jgi:transcriptional regulator with XRE-family HTH domain
VIPQAGPNPLWITNPLTGGEEASRSWPIDRYAAFLGQHEGRVMIAPPQPDLQWWESGSYSGRPIREILAERDIGTLFGFLRSRGWSRAAIAAATGLAETRVRVVTQGRQQVVSYGVLERIANGLGIPRGYLGLAYTDQPSPAPTVPDSDSWPAERAPVSGEAVSDQVALTDIYRRIDYRSGAPHVARDVETHLSRLSGMAELPHSRRIHQELLQAIGDAAQLAAWLRIDMQDYDQARVHCATVIAAAREAQDLSLHAYVLGILGYTHLHADDGPAALRILSDAADIARAPSVPAAVASWLAEAVAEAQGLRGDVRAGLCSLAEAERRFDGVTADNTPAYLTFYNAECHVARLKGRCLMRLRQPAAAVAASQSALTMLPDTFVRERAGTLIDLAFAFVQLKEIDEACRIAGEAYDLATQTRSDRSRQRLNQLLISLLPHTGREPVQTLYRRLLLG